MNHGKGFKELVQEIREEEAAKARAEAFRSIAKKHPKAINAEIEIDLNQAIQEAKRTQLKSIKKVAKMELEELARLGGCHHPRLLSDVLSENINVDTRTGELRIVDSRSRLLLRDELTGSPIGLDGLISKARQNPDLAPLFNETHYKPEGKAKTLTTSAGNVKNPWKKETFNLTRQGQIIRENPQLAQALMEEAKQ